jgi:hypothetical protein
MPRRGIISIAMFDSDLSRAPDRQETKSHPELFEAA